MILKLDEKESRRNWDFKPGFTDGEIKLYRTLAKSVSTSTHNYSLAEIIRQLTWIGYKILKSRKHRVWRAFWMEEYDEVSTLKEELKELEEKFGD